MSRAPSYDAMFPAFKPTTITVRRDAGVEHTLELIPRVVGETLDQTEELAPTLKGRGTVETCRNIWNFCKKNFKYKQDEEGKEQVRSPRRSWLDRHKGIDCDCYSTLISSILTNLGIPHFLRVTKYPNPADPSMPASQIPYSHIYVVAMDGGRAVKIDPVTEFFDFEQPYLAKTDIKMKLEYLNGLPDQATGSVDQIDLGLDGLFRKRPRPAPNQRTPTPTTLAPPNRQKGKGANIINRLNPAAVLLRTGILLGMKMDMFNIASKLRYAYLTDSQAKTRKLNMARLAHLRKVHAKLERAVYLGGGKPENLKKAILEGKGNRDKAVPLNGLGMPNFNSLNHDLDTPVSEILGPLIYQSEVVAPMNGLGSLGEVTAAAAIAAATAMLGAVAAVLKSVGDVKAGGAPGASSAGEEAALTIPQYQDESSVPSGQGQYPAPYEGQVTQMPGEEAYPDPSGANSRTSDSDGTETTETNKVVQWAKDNPLIAFGVIPVASVTLGYVIWKAAKGARGRKGGGAVNGLDGTKPKAPAKKGKTTAKGRGKSPVHKLKL